MTLNYDILGLALSTEHQKRQDELWNMARYTPTPCNGKSVKTAAREYVLQLEALIVRLEEIERQQEEIFKLKRQAIVEDLSNKDDDLPF